MIVAEHGLGDFEVGDHAVLHGPDATMLPGVRPSISFGFRTDGQHVGRARLNGYNRRFAQDDSTVPHIDEGVGCARSIPISLENRLCELRKHEFA